MNSHEKQAGQSTRDMADRRYKTRIWFVLITLGIALLILVMVFNSKVLGIGGFGFLGLLILYRLLIDFTEVKARRMRKAERRAVRGAKAEEKIGSKPNTKAQGAMVWENREKILKALSTPK